LKLVDGVRSGVTAHGPSRELQPPSPATVDEPKGAIVLLEGGKEAFRGRRRKYKLLE
jgi:hypothetical protein